MINYVSQRNNTSLLSRSLVIPDLTHAHAEAGTDLPNHLEEALAVGYCPGCVLRNHKQTCYVCQTQISQAGLSISSSNSPADHPEGGKFSLHVSFQILIKHISRASECL